MHCEIKFYLKVREKRKENEILKNSNHGNYFSEEEEDCAQSSEESAPLPKRKKNNAECETTVKNNTVYPEIMSPPLSVPKNSNLNNQVTPSKAQSTHNRSLNASSVRCNLQKNSSSSMQSSTALSTLLEGNSNSSWAEMESYVIGNIQMHPPTLGTRQMLILR